MHAIASPLGSMGQKSVHRPLSNLGGKCEHGNEATIPCHRRLHLKYTQGLTALCPGLAAHPTLRVLDLEAKVGLWKFCMLHGSNQPHLACSCGAAQLCLIQYPLHSLQGISLQGCNALGGALVTNTVLQTLLLAENNLRHPAGEPAVHTWNSNSNTGCTW
jgi:hypothetical protein